MMMNIFSIFDPMTSMNFSLNWLSMMLIFILMPCQFWLIPSRFIFLFYTMINYIFKEFKILIT